MEAHPVRQLPSIRDGQYAWAVQLDPLWGAPSTHTTLEQMFFLGEHVAQIVAYEEYRRNLMRRRGGEIHIAVAQRRRSLVTPYSMTTAAREIGDQPELLSAA